jgi:ABC-type branched-subunit amino acid transport system ATPase component
VAVANVSLEVAPHEVVGLIGANGAGKSTLMNAICGFVPADGRVTLGGEDITGLRPHERARRGLGRTFQTARLFGELSVTDTVLVALESQRRSGLTTSLLGTPGARATERSKRSEAAALIDLVGLGRYATTRIADLSTGTRRIVELACLIGLGARVLCLDEPTAGVAQRETEAFGPLLRDIRRSLGAAMVVIEHDMPFIAAVSDRLVCLETGRVIAEGTPEAVRRDPAVVASYLGTDVRAIERSATT